MIEHRRRAYRRGARESGRGSHSEDCGLRILMQRHDKCDRRSIGRRRRHCENKLADPDIAAVFEYSPVRDDRERSMEAVEHERELAAALAGQQRDGRLQRDVSFP